MSIAKVIEVIAEGRSVENAVENAVKEASGTVSNIRHVNIENIQALIDENAVKQYRINAKITFLVMH